MRKLSLLAGVLLMFLIIASGCGDQTDKQTGSDSGQTVKAEEQQAAAQTLQIKSYYTDDQVLNLAEEKHDIVFEQEQDKYLAALKTLSKANDSTLIALWEGTEFLSATLKDKGALTVDVHVNSDAHLGAPGEQLAIQALLKTMYQFDEVQTVDILVDGKSVETLLGHVDLEHPFTRNSVEQAGK